MHKVKTSYDGPRLSTRPLTLASTPGSAGSSGRRSTPTVSALLARGRALLQDLSRSLQLQRWRVSPKRIAVAAGLFLTLVLLRRLFAGSPATAHAAVDDHLSLPPLSEHDANRLDMGEEECRRQFGALYQQLDDNQAYWQVRGGISMQNLDRAEREVSEGWGMARVLIKDRKMYIRSYQETWQTERVRGVLHLLYTAVTSWPASDEPIRPLELVFSTADRDGFESERSGWSLAKRVNGTEGVYLMPDYGFAAWPTAKIADFAEVRQEIAAIEQHTPWEAKANKAFWRGFIADYDIRVDMMRQSSGEGSSAWSDIKETTFQLPENLTPEEKAKWAPIIPIVEHCGHKYLVQTEGNSYSGRLKYIISCESVIVAHEPAWTQHFHPALDARAGSPNQNWVWTPGPGFKGLKETIRTLQGSSGRNGRARRIAQNARRTMGLRYLTPAATACYTRAALKSYGKMFWPDVEPVKGGGVGPTNLPLTPGDVEYGVWTIQGMPNR